MGVEEEKEGPKDGITEESEKVACITGNVFRPGSIHDMDKREFWMNVLKCPPWVQSVLQFGYRIPFHKIPGPYEEPNNASVRENGPIVEEIIQELISTGVIELVTTKPVCVNPLGLVTKQTTDGVKHRLVLDASRWVNNCINPPVVKLAHLDKALLMTKKNDFQVVFDLKSAYHNVRIADEHVTYLGASVWLKGQKRFFVFKHLPFGLNSAVHAITKLWKPLVAHIHSKGIRMSIYIDDGRVLAASEEEAEKVRQFVYDVVQKAGWQLAMTKSDGPGEASKKKQYLGFEIDTGKMLVTYPSHKLDDFCKMVKEALTKDQIHVKALARVLGKLNSLTPSHGVAARICTKSSYVILESHVESHGWSGLVSWSPEARRELYFFVEIARNFNGSKLLTELTDVRVDAILQNPQSSQTTTGMSSVDTVLVSDSSVVKAAVKYLHGQKSTWTSLYRFDETEMSLSSGARELLAVHKFLQDEKRREELRDANIFWGTDSTNLVAFLTKGSGKPKIQCKIFEILQMLESVNCVLTPVHLYREDERLQQVDYLSKCLDTDNWSIDFNSFKELDAIFHFEVDMFADDKNKRAPVFVSKFYHKDSLAVDAFSIQWSGILWLCPPTSLIIKVINRICSSKCQGVLIVPNWPAADFYCCIFDDIKVLPPFQVVKEFQPFIYQNEGARNTPLLGFTKFTFFALSFDTKNTST